ncbi:MAG: DUF2237 family protein, partial [Myxococcota bacterium]
MSRARREVQEGQIPRPFHDIVCAVMNDEILRCSSAVSNDLPTPAHACDFLGLKAGDRLCLCGARRKRTLEAGCTSKVVLAGKNELSLQLVPLEVRFAHDIDGL